MEFLSAVAEFPFLRHALIAGALAGIACGVVGTYVVVRRISYIAGAIAHCVLAGLGVAPEAAYLDARTGRWATLMPARPLLPGAGNGARHLMFLS